MPLRNLIMEGTQDNTSYKYCVVPLCKNTTLTSPDKNFFVIPSDRKARKKWFKVMRREPLSENSICYCCEDHFDMEKDTKNMISYRLMGGTLHLKEDILPNKFTCQNPEDKQDYSKVEKRRRNEFREHLSLEDKISVSQQPTESVSFAPDFEESQEPEDPLIIPVDNQKLYTETKQNKNTNSQVAIAAKISNRSEGISSENYQGNSECRCCLATGQHSHIFGKLESNMLSENLNIHLITEPRLPQFICSNCIKFLDEIKAFRENVLATETKLLRIITEDTIPPQHTAIVESKVLQSLQNDPLEIGPGSIEVKIEEYNCDDVTEMSWAEDASESLHTESDVAVLMKNVETEDILQNTIVPLPDQERQSLKTEFDIFDTGGKKTASLNTTRKKRTSKRKYKEKIQEAKKNLVFTYINIGDKPELATNNTKIRANIILILQNSTILPFCLKKANCFKCFYCEQTHGLFRDLKQHYLNLHKTNPNDYTIFKELQAKNKKIVHADISNVICKLCNDTIATIDDLVQHLINVHKKTYYSDIKSDVNVPSHGVIGYKLDKDNLQCHICETEFRFLKYLISHMIKHYGCFTCTTCDKKFVTFERYNEHCKTHVKTETKCTDCNLVFSTRRKMLDHRYLKHIKKKIKTVKCTECPLTFPTTRPILRFQHMEKEHGIKRPVYKCDVCSKTYQTIHGLNHHTRSVHARKNEFMCDICGYVTTEKTIMNRHLDHHNGIRKFECDYCQKKFRTKGSLRLHFRGHFNDKRFACSLCNAAFIQKHCLKSHIKSRHPDSGIDLTQL